MRIGVCSRWVDVRPEVDPLSGEVSTDARRGGFSPADQAALEVALGLSDRWGATVELVSVGPSTTEPALRELAAAGSDAVVRLVRVEAGDVAGGLAAALLDADLVVCGDVSLDGGSGAVPALLAHHLAVGQALGLVAVEPGDAGEIVAVRRLGGGRSERVRVRAPAVISVEGSVASLRRASLPALLAARDREVVVIEVDGSTREPVVVASGSWRPRARALPPPVGEQARDRIVALTGALADRTPPRVIEADPAAAAAAILVQLREWGYLADPAQR